MAMRGPSACPALLAALVLCSCGPFPDGRAAGVDLRPPLVQCVRAAGPGEIVVSFDEDAEVLAERTAVTPALPVGAISARGKEVCIAVGPQVPGAVYVLATEARDARGNAAAFQAEFSGWNGSVPRLLVNEVCTRGSGSVHTDRVELKVLAAGNMGGVVVYDGTPSSFVSRLVFPAFSVRAGDFLVVHCKPQGVPGETDETADPDAAMAPDACPGARDFWVRDGTGLGGNNGVISVYERTGGRCLDGILYSNRTSQSAEAWRGFGSSDMLDRAEELARDGGWKAAGSRILPEDGVNPDGSTATRTLCRSSASSDTDGPEDWHIVPTRGDSMGAENTDERWTP